MKWFFDKPTRKISHMCHMFVEGGRIGFVNECIDVSAATITEMTMWWRMKLWQHWLEWNIMKKWNKHEWSGWLSWIEVLVRVRVGEETCGPMLVVRDVTTLDGDEYNDKTIYVRLLRKYIRVIRVCDGPANGAQRSGAECGIEQNVCNEQSQWMRWQEKINDQRYEWMNEWT